MALETAADRRSLFEMDGQEFQVEDGVGGVLEVDDGSGGLRGPIGILSYEHTLVGAELDIASREPVAVLPTGEIHGVDVGWEITTSEGLFVVAEPPRHDGAGLSILILARPDPDPIS